MAEIGGEVDDGSTASPAEVAVELYKLLLPHTSVVRQRAVRAAMESLGESFGSHLSTLNPRGADSTPADGEDASGPFADLKIGPRAARWLQRSGITRPMLDELFHVTDSGVEVTASSVPGGSKREMTLNCYLLCGIRGLLADDTPALHDSEAIALCKRMAAYDKNNHTTYRTSIGNKMSGTRPNFMLTGPGETSAAQLVRLMAQAQ